MTDPDEHAERERGGPTDEDVTQLLAAARGGDREALDRLFTVVYRRLREIAHGQIGKQRRGDTLGTTALVHEAYLKMTRGATPLDRNHFYAVAATAMRYILVDYARRRQAAKRGEGPEQTTLDDERLGLDAESLDARAAEVVAVDEALGRLEQLDPRLASLVEMRFFAGLSVEETAVAMEVSERTVQRDWIRARAFLQRELARTSGP